MTRTTAQRILLYLNEVVHNRIEDRSRIQMYIYTSDPDDEAFVKEANETIMKIDREIKEIQDVMDTVIEEVGP